MKFQLPHTSILTILHSHVPDGSFEHTPKGVQTQWLRVCKKQNPYTAQPKRDGGRWGVVPASERQEILVAQASLIRAQRNEMALNIIESELVLIQDSVKIHHASYFVHAPPDPRSRK